MSLTSTPNNKFFGIQRLHALEARIVENRKNETIAIYLVLHGKVTITVKGCPTEIEAHHLYCGCFDRSPGIEIGEGTEGYVIHLNKELLSNVDQELYCPHFPALYSIALRGEVIAAGTFLSEGKNLSELMLQEMEGEEYLKTQIVNGLLNIFMLRLIRQSDMSGMVSANGARHALVRKFHDLLEKNFRTFKKVSEYASLLCVSPNHLNTIIKQTTGNSASFYIRQRVVSEAVRQLRLTGASMKEVAWKLGFNDNAISVNFSRR